MKRMCLGLAATLATVSLACAQSYRDAGGTKVDGFVPLAGCTANGACSGPVSAGNPLPVSGALSANIVSYQPTATGAPLAATTTSSRVALPAGATVVVYNTGLVSAYVAMGGSTVTATTSNDVIPPNSWAAFSPGTATFIAGVTASGSTTLNVTGGSGVPEGAAGGAIPTGSAGAPNANVLSVQGVGGGTALPMSAASLPLPAGAATAANQTSVIGPVAPGAAATSSLATGGVFNTALPTLTNGQQAAIQLDASGRQIVNVGALPALPAGANAIGSVSVSGNAGTPTQAGVTVGVTSTTVLAAASATSFLKLCVASLAANGVWVRWDGGVATAAAPAEYIPPGQCDSWVKSTGFLPTSAITAIAPAATAVSLIYN